MEIFYQSVLPSLLTGLICLWIGHRLGRGGEAIDRRRIFKAKLRDLGSKAREQHAMYLWKFYGEYRDGVRAACHAAVDDVPWFRKRRFTRLVDSFLELKDSDLQPEHGLGTDDNETRNRKFQQVCVNLQKLLTDIADAA